LTKLEAGALGVGGDFGGDLQGEGQGCATGAGVYAWGGAGTDGFEEVFEFEAEGFGVGEIELLEVQAGGGVGRGPRAQG